MKRFHRLLCALFGCKPVCLSRQSLHDGMVQASCWKCVRCQKEEWNQR